MGLNLLCHSFFADTHKMIVRKAEHRDIDQIVSFQIKMALETEDINLQQPIVEQGVEGVFSDDSKGQYFIAEIDDVIVGSLLTTYEWSDWRNGTVLWIQSVYVLPDFRKRGIYSKMYAHIKSIVQQDNHIFGIRLYADRSNKIAQKVYENLGMNQDHYATFEWMK